jgi:hypothetical protein
MRLSFFSAILIVKNNMNLTQYLKLRTTSKIVIIGKLGMKEKLTVYFLNLIL